jgi:uncharacterized membrane protein (UPF0127 family)
MTRCLRAVRMLLASIFLGAVCGVVGAEQPLESLDSFPQTTARITSSGGSQQFDIWIANTSARSEQGLMFVRSLAHDKGMLFPRNNSGPMAMWMKNTLIPLDMLFVDSRGEIIYIKHSAKPESEEIIQVPAPVITPVAAVLELAGGECHRRHIEQGDTIAVAAAPR